MNKQLPENLLEKYRRGECSPEEAQVIEKWFDAVGNEGGEEFEDEFIRIQLELIKSRIDASIAPGQSYPRRIISSRLLAAASLLLLLGCFAALYFKPGAAMAPAKQAGFERRLSKGWIFVQTAKGTTHQFKLPDGSLITLNALSRLRYPVKFVNHKRPVYLDEGEALFDVAKDRSSPFIVYTTKFATTALGTAFNIRSYALEHKVSIYLIHGKIRVDDLQPRPGKLRSAVLLPHQQIVLNKQSGRLVESDFKDELPVTAWTTGALSFQDASADEVINSIQNHFNITIKNNSTRNNWSYTGTFRNEPLADVLKTVCLTEGITFNINKNIVTLN